jgi:hypothetical protein
MLGLEKREKTAKPAMTTLAEKKRENSHIINANSYCEKKEKTATFLLMTFAFCSACSYFFLWENHSGAE